MIDWVRDGWDEDELFVTPRLQRLRWHLQELSLPWRDQGLEQYETLCRARIVAGVEWQAAIVSLGSIVSEWAKDRRERGVRT